MRLLVLFALLPLSALAQTESPANGTTPSAPRSQYLTEPAAPAPARTTPAPTTPARSTPPPVARPLLAAATPATTAAAPATTPAAVATAVPVTATPVIALPGQTPAAPVTPPLTLEQRRQQELLANAGKLDQANRDLLAKNQLMQLEIEKLATQVNVLKNDRSNEGIRNGALAVIAGFLLGWFFASLRGGSKSSSW